MSVQTAKDLAVIIGLAVALFITGLLAFLVPACRATSVDPMVVLRYE